MRRPGIADEWVRTINNNGEGGLTFCGVLEEQYQDIAFRWSNETKRNYDREFNNIILPALASHNDKIISEYSKEDFDKAIEAIRNRGYLKNNVRYFYSESSLRHYAQLIYYVVFYASRANYCDNVLWGTEFMLDDIEAGRKTDVKLKLKKSLTTKQETKLAQFLFDADYLPGQYMGILLMYALGLRNGEACGLNYGDIKPLLEHPDYKMAWIYKSTINSTTKLQSSGKTWNTGRLVPVPQKLLELIHKRRQEIAEYLKLYDNVDEVIDQLPIACKGGIENYNQRCSAKDLTIVSHEIFQKIGLSPVQLAYINNDLSGVTLHEMIREKDATAYLMRRNFATHLQILGFSVSEIQYLIGHDVEDSYETRNEYMVSDRLFAMAKRLALRPLVNDIVTLDDNQKEIHITPSSKTKIRILAQEPGDVLCVKLTGQQIGKGVEIVCYNDKYKKRYDRSIDIQKLYHAAMS